MASTFFPFEAGSPRSHFIVQGDLEDAICPCHIEFRIYNKTSACQMLGLQECVTISGTLDSFELCFVNL